LPRDAELAVPSARLLLTAGFRPRSSTGAANRAERGVTDVAGLYVVGLPWLHTWGSGHFAGIGRDAEYLAERIEAGDRTASVTELPRPAFGRCHGAR
jgi:hypothetical protein